MKLVSIIIPVYNVQNYLERCVDSVLNQTYSNLEVIIVDDGSTDDSPDICDRYAQLDCRVKVIHQKNKGLSGARNTGLKQVSGDYIYFIDSDDFLDLSIIEKCVIAIDSNNADIVHFNALVVHNNQTRAYMSAFDGNVLSGEEYLSRMISQGAVSVPVWMYFYRASFLQTTGLTFAEGRIFEDELWTPQILLQASRVMFLNMGGYYYMIRDNSIMTSSQKSLSKFISHDLNCHELSNLKPLFKDKYNQLLFLDYLARIYMESVKYLNLSDNDHIRSIDEEFISSNIRGFKSWCKYLLYKLSKKLYFKVKGI